MMDIDSIVEYIRQDTVLFASAWNEELQRHGRGAIVILPPGKESPEEDVKVEFWTVEELRSSLRSLKAEDEFVYRWIRECEEEGGLPVMVLAHHPTAPSSYELVFHRFVAPPD